MIRPAVDPPRRLSHRPQLGDDAGVSLVELIVYSVVSAVVVLAVASMFATGLTTGAQTQERDRATGQAQSVSDSLRASVRNASALRVDGPLLRARVATGASAWECRAWVLVGDELRYRSSSSAIAAGPYDTWAVLASGVSGTLASGAPFTGGGTQLQLGIVVALGDASVPVSSSVTAQARAEGAGSCW